MTNEQAKEIAAAARAVVVAPREAVHDVGVGRVVCCECWED